jgi:hypothetical protein
MEVSSVVYDILIHRIQIVSLSERKENGMKKDLAQDCICVKSRKDTPRLGQR